MHGLSAHVGRWSFERLEALLRADVWGPLGVEPASVKKGKLRLSTNRWCLQVMVNYAPNLRTMRVIDS